jgi:hypothetical protein
MGEGKEKAPASELERLGIAISKEKDAYGGEYLLVKLASGSQEPEEPGRSFQFQGDDCLELMGLPDQEQAAIKHGPRALEDLLNIVIRKAQSQQNQG